MPFSTTGSVVSTDLDNMLRGFYRDNADHVVAGPVVETTLASVNIAANTIGPTGGLFVLAVGTTVGAGGNKSIKLYFGSQIVMVLTVPAGNQSWMIKAWIYNTSTGVQRIFVESGVWAALVNVSGAPALLYEYETAAIDTTANQTLKVTTTNVNAGDTATGTMFDVYIAQIT